MKTGATAFLLSAVVAAFGQSEGTVDFQNQVHPVLAERCIGCHGEARRDGGLSLSTYGNALEGGRSGAVIHPGNSKKSLLIDRVTGQTPPRMPLGGNPLSDSELALLRTWIDEGARETRTSAAAQPKWEAPLSLSRSAVPKVVWEGWATPIDRFVAAYLAGQGVREPQSISDTLFARRAHLDIWGLLPEPEALRAFVNDTSSAKREKLVLSLLSDNTKYSEHWISFWNDLLRNEEGVTYHSEMDSRKSITEWLLSSLKSNLPYDRFITKLLNPTGELDPEGFLIGVNWRGTISASQSPAMQAAQNTAQVFLGINLKCNACHDSFVSRWKLKQAYAMAAYFSKEPKLQLFRCDVAQQEFAKPTFLYPQLDRKPKSDTLSARRATAAAIFTDRRNGRMPRTLVNRIWQRLYGRGLVSDSDEMDGEPWNPALLDWLAADFAANGYDVKRLIGSIVASRSYQLPAVERTSEQPRQYSFRGPEVRRLTAEQFGDTIGAITGEWHIYQTPSATAPPAAPSKTTDVAAGSTRNLSGAAHGGVADPNTPGVDAGRAKAKPPTASVTAPPPRPGSLVFTREWRATANPLSRALGRPIRDQVYSTRETNATTLQALELANGVTLTNWLGRGARKMLGELPPEPVSLFNAPIRGGRNVTTPFDVDITGAKKVWLLLQDVGSYSPELVEAVWSDVEVVGPAGVEPLTSLKPLDDSGLRMSTEPVTNAGDNNGHDVRVKTPSLLVYDLSARGFTRLRGSITLENKTITSDINPNVRFFIFRDEPNMERLTPVSPVSAPLPAGPALQSSREVVDRVFWYALGRAPSAEERSTAEAAINDTSRPSGVSWEGVADLLWAVLMKPEFQLIY